MSSSCDTSGDESDQGQDKFSEDNAGVGRSYECTFCKRGFTNAQALGGHMNIHRKDKLKAKQACKQQESALSRKSKSNNTHNNDHEVCTQQISSQQQQEQQNFYYPSSRAYVTYHQFHFPSANPSYQFQVLDHHGYYRNFALHGGFGDANLSLRIGSPDDEERKEDIEVSEVDLELRLGPNSTFT